MITTLFLNNRTQAVRLPAEYRFNNTVQKVYVRSIGVERIICPVENIWDSFFDSNSPMVSEDFERGEQVTSNRDSL